MQQATQAEENTVIPAGVFLLNILQDEEAVCSKAATLCVLCCLEAQRVA